MSNTLEGAARNLFAAPNFAHLSVPRRDGTIQNAVIWIDVDEADNLVINSAEGRGWPQNLRRAGAATISIHNQDNPYEFATVTAKLTGDTNDGAEDVIDALAKKYLDVDSYPARTEGEVRVTFTLTPQRVYHRRG